MIRLLVGVILGIGFLFFGLAGLVAGVDMMTRGIGGEDMWAALMMGGMMGAIGLLIVIISVKAYRRRRAIARGAKVQGVDRGEVEGTLMGIGMASSFDDFGD